MSKLTLECPLTSTVDAIKSILVFHHYVGYSEMLSGGPPLLEAVDLL